MATTAVIQARMGSTRLPGKVLKPILGKPMLWHIVQRVRCAPEVARVVVATSDQPEDSPVREFCRLHGIDSFAGHKEDVLDRFFHAALRYVADPILRITADCPFVDPSLIGRLIALYRTGNYDHVGIATGAGAIHLEGGRFPDGLDAECFSFAALEQTWREADTPSDREHVTPYLWRVEGRFRVGMLKADGDYSQMRWTVDNAADFELVCRIYGALYSEERPFLMADILDFMTGNHDLSELNRAFIGSEGYHTLWDPDKRSIRS